MPPDRYCGPMTPGTQFAVSHFAGRAGDHNDRAMTGSPAIAAELTRRLGTAAAVVGSPAVPLNSDWRTELDAALPALTVMREWYESILSSGQRPATALSRCAVALATLPAVATYRPDAVVVWFDAHADINTPDTTNTGYLGGLALSGPLGFWDSGLGGGLMPGNVILAGSRDIDLAEQDLIEKTDLSVVPPGPRFASRLAAAVAGRPVYVHIDCDVLDPDIVPTDYKVPGGLTLVELHDATAELASAEVVGVEIGEFEASGTFERTRTGARALMDSIEPILV